MTRQPPDSLIVKREPVHDRAWTLRYEREVRQAKKEGPKQCSVTGCKTHLRVGNRERGVCERCWRKKNQ